MLAATLVLTGCGGGTTSGSSSRASSSRGDAALPRGPLKGAAAAGAQPVRLAPAQAIVYTADLTVRAADVAGAATRARQIVAAAGGYVSNETATDAPGSHPSATIIFKIPPKSYPGALDQLGSGRLGTRLSLQQQAEDVTQDVADVDSRVRSAKATLSSFRALLGKATNVDDVIRIEQEIAQREADLESLQARQKALGAQTAFATVTLRLQGTTAAHPGRKAAGGFTGGLASGWRAFTAFLGGLSLVLGWLLPFLGIAALVGLPALWAWRRRRAAGSRAG